MQLRAQCLPFAPDHTNLCVVSPRRQQRILAPVTLERPRMSADTLARPQVSNTVVASHFPTLFMVREYANCDGLNQRLERLMLRLEKETTNIAAASTNIGGYHSDTTLFSRQEVEIVALRDLVLAALQEYVPKFLEANCYTQTTMLNPMIWGWGINMCAVYINFHKVHTC